jgi:hypothetical protein
MKKSRRQLKNLISFLKETRRAPADVRISLAADENAEIMHGTVWRFFCWTTSGSDIIRCARELEDLPSEFRLGVLLHETGHILEDFFEENDSEVQTDAWCKKIDPDYKYAEIRVPGQGMSHFLQRTGDRFTEEIEKWSR